MSEIIVPLGKTAKKIGDTTASGEGAAVVKGSQAVSTATPETTKQSAIKSAAEKITVPEGYKPIRKTLVERGVDNSRIGWSDGAVTIDGKAVYTPQYNDDGTTYADESALRKMTDTAYKNINDNLVGARDYVTSNGYSGIVDWDGEKVLIGGVALEPKYVTDGIAYVPQSELDSVIKGFEARNGIIGSDGALNKHDEKYSERISDALNALTERKAFSYRPEDDPAYLAYKDQYERIAEEAYRRVLNDNNTSATGASGAVLSEAIASRDRYLKELTDMIPVLEQNAYNRYTGETDRLRGNLESITDIADSYYERLYESNRDAVDDVTSAGEAERDEKQRWEENVRENEQNRILNERNAIRDSYELAQLAAEIQYYPQQAEAELEEARLKNEAMALENAVTRGFFTSADEAALPWLSGYRTYSGYTLDPQLALVALEYDTVHAKKRAEINAKMGW